MTEKNTRLQFEQKHVLSAYREEVKKGLEKLARLAKRLGLPLPTWEFTEDYEYGFSVLEYKGYDGYESVELYEDYIEDCFDVTIDIAETLKVSGDWSLIGVLDHSEGLEHQISENLAMPSHFTSARAKCDHCGRDQKRVKSYVTHNSETGEFKQIGKTCMTQHFGVKPTSFISMYNAISKFSPIIEGFGRKNYKGREERRAWSTELIAAEAVHMVSNRGHVKNEWKEERTGEYYRGEAQYRMMRSNSGLSTQDLVMSSLNAQTELERAQKGYKKESVNYDYSMIPLPSYKKEIKEFKAFLSALEVDMEEYEVGSSEGIVKRMLPKNDFNNWKQQIKGLFDNSLLFVKQVGAMCSAYNFYLNEKKKAEALKDRPVSEFVLQLGEVFEGEVTLDMKRTGSGMYGNWFLYKMRDAKGNILTYMGSKFIEQFEEEGAKVTIKGKVKKHETYQSEKQTKVSHVKVLA